MSYLKDETSIDSGNPIELYLFTYNGVSYEYTSSQQAYSCVIDDNRHIFNAEYIHRSDSLKLGDSSGSQESCIITVPRNNNVALLYQGAPPEQDSVTVSVYRTHGQYSGEYIKILDGVISQVRFNGSEAELTVNIENVLKRNIPTGSLSYYCQNCIYDADCGLDENLYGVKYLVEDIEGLTLTSTALADKGDDFYTDGFIKMGNAFRMIKKHAGKTITIKYPISASDKSGSFIAYPGCNGLFSICAKKFSNTDNFSGVPYIMPYNAFNHPTDKGAYWIDSVVIVRDSGAKIY